MKNKIITLLIVIMAISCISGCISENSGEPVTTSAPTTTAAPTTTPAPTTSAPTTVPPATYTDVDPSDARSLMVQNPDLYVIDVSSTWNEGHIPGAASFPLGSAFDKAVFSLPKSSEYLVYGATTLESNEAVSKMVSVGFSKVYRLQGNLAGWVEQGYRLSEHMRLTSSAIRDGYSIPSKYTCDGSDYNPELSVSDVPANARSLVVTVIDKDDSDKVHWTMWNIPVCETIEKDSAPGTIGNNDFKNNCYNGPCPPRDESTHRYEFTVYALDADIRLPTGSSYSQLMSAIAGHILDSDTITGTYKALERAAGGGCNCGGS